jgi:hypothetical protein
MKVQNRESFASIVPNIARISEIVGGFLLGPQYDILQSLIGEYNQDPKIKEIMSMVTKNVDDINRFFEKAGLSIRMTGSNDGDNLYIGTVLKLIFKWVKSGIDTTITTENEERFKGFYFGEGIQLYVANGEERPTIAELKTQNGDSVFMLYRPEGIKIEPIQGYLDTMSLRLMEEIYNPQRYTSVTGKLAAPNIGFSGRANVNELTGVWTGMGLITQCVAENMTVLNKEGGKVITGVGMEESLGISWDPYLYINGPFVVWVVRPGHKLPIYCAYFAPDSWEPAE